MDHAVRSLRILPGTVGPGRPHVVQHWIVCRVGSARARVEANYQHPITGGVRVRYLEMHMSHAPSLYIHFFSLEKIRHFCPSQFRSSRQTTPWFLTSPSCPTRQ